MEDITEFAIQKKKPQKNWNNSFFYLHMKIRENSGIDFVRVICLTRQGYQMNSGSFGLKFS